VAIQSTSETWPWMASLRSQWRDCGPGLGAAPPALFRSVAEIARIGAAVASSMTGIAAIPIATAAGSASNAHADSRGSNPPAVTPIAHTASAYITAPGNNAASSDNAASAHNGSAVKTCLDTPPAGAHTASATKGAYQCERARARRGYLMICSGCAVQGRWFGERRMTKEREA
jgi:hypothetical protein